MFEKLQTHTALGITLCKHCCIKDGPTKPKLNNKKMQIFAKYCTSTRVLEYERNLKATHRCINGLSNTLDKSLLLTKKHKQLSAKYPATKHSNSSENASFCTFQLCSINVKCQKNTTFTVYVLFFFLPNRKTKISTTTKTSGLQYLSIIESVLALGTQLSIRKQQMNEYCLHPKKFNTFKKWCNNKTDTQSSDESKNDALHYDISQPENPQPSQIGKYNRLSYPNHCRSRRRNPKNRNRDSIQSVNNNNNNKSNSNSIQNNNNNTNCTQTVNNNNANSVHKLLELINSVAEMRISVTDSVDTEAYDGEFRHLPKFESIDVVCTVSVQFMYCFYI
jgi:hypothetical protein